MSDSLNAPSESAVSVLHCDDSAVIRGFISRMLAGNADINHVGSATNGQMAIQMVEKLQPDVLVLDIEMPIMDGITAIPQLLEKKPDLKIIMCSTLTTQNGSMTFKAMTLGAVDCIAKPTAVQDLYATDNFKTTLLDKVINIGRSTKNRSARAPATTAGATLKQAVSLHPRLPKTITLRKPNEGYAGRPSILAIGSSTGGPQALFKVLKDLGNINIPIVLTQHMPPTFTRILAEHIRTNCLIPAVEAEQGMVLENGRVHVAPGGKHMLLVKKGTGVEVEVNDGPMENFCKPAVDPMLRSLIPIYGDKITVAILTGMGQDGLKGAREVVAKGGRILAQDEISSVVWGMPGAVALDGICHEVIRLDDIGTRLRKIATTGWN